MGFATWGSGLMPRIVSLFIIASAFITLVLGSVGIAKQMSRERPDAFDFGTISNDAENRRTFLIPNARDQKLHLLTAASSCACVQILSYPQEIAPHRKGEVTVRWLPSEPGEKACKIVFETDDPGNGPLSFEIRASIKPSPGAAPGELSHPGERRSGTKIPSEWLTRRLKPRDPALVVSVESILKEMKGKPEAILVDVRPRSEFEKSRIPGSIQVDLFAVKTKNLLKAKPLVLVNEGYSCSRLEEEVKGLRDAGFMASILDGGLSEWRRKGGPLEGDAFAQKDLNKIPPQIFFQERVYDNWVVIDATTANKHMAASLLPENIPMVSSNGPEPPAAQLKAIMARRKAMPSLFFLILDDDGKDQERLEKLLTEAGISRVFFLDGGIAGYRSFLEQQAEPAAIPRTSRKGGRTMRTLPLKRASLICAGFLCSFCPHSLLHRKASPAGHGKGLAHGSPGAGHDAASPVPLQLAERRDSALGQGGALDLCPGKADGGPKVCEA